jgi:large subunit ribosomal protein L17
MRHIKKNNHLGRTKSHREAMLSNMASSLIVHKRIFTTTAKAKALRKFIEPLITKSKISAKTSEEAMHARRTVFAELQNKHAVTELFSNVSEKVGDRPGGYTRIIKTGNRLGDNAAMCFIELVDFNENMMKDTSKKAATKTRRSRRKATGAEAAVPAAETTTKKAAKAAPPIVPDIVEEAVAEASVIEEATAQVEEVIAQAEEVPEMED